MRSFLLLLVVAVVAGTVYFQRQKPPEQPIPPEPRLAPLGIYFLTEYMSVRTDRGITGWLPGQELQTIPGEDATGGKRLLTDGTLQLEVPLSALTRDMDLAARLRTADASAQASDSARRSAETARAKFDQKRLDMARDADLQVTALDQKLKDEIAAAPNEHEREALRAKHSRILDEALQRQKRLQDAQ